MINPMKIYTFVPEGGNMCQAKTSTSGEASSPSALQSSVDIAALELIERLVGTLASVASCTNYGLHDEWPIIERPEDCECALCDGRRFLKASARSQLEKARRAADEVQPDQPLPDTNKIQGADDV